MNGLGIIDNPPNFAGLDHEQIPNFQLGYLDAGQHELESIRSPLVVDDDV